ncbi:TIGR02678 family protein [Rhabdochromatium marinum]|uniref:TIGR02678 family protein n=1 Tax=Rhabdochromatium marinum TaxID=48729 RepID=UPI003083FB41
MGCASPIWKPGPSRVRRPSGHRSGIRRRALRGLLMQPLLYADHPAYRLVKRHIDWLREWLHSETRWDLRLEADFARLAKTAPEHDDGSRAARPGRRPVDLDFTCRRYALLCLVLAGLERGEMQSTLGRLGKTAMDQSAEPAVQASGLVFELRTQEDRRDLVAVVRLLLNLGVLVRVAGSEDAYIQNETKDVLYDIDRHVLSALLVTRRGPSLVDTLEQPADSLDRRIGAITARFVADTPEARNRELRQRLTERLLDDPVLYYDELDEDERAYLFNQRHAIVQRIQEATGLVPEMRAEGIAMVDPEGDLADQRMPSEGTEGHITLLLAGHLAERLSQDRAVSWSDLHDAYRTWVERYGRYWKKAAKDPDAGPSFCREAAERLASLGLARIEADGVRPLPAIARYAVEAPRISRSCKSG